MKKALLFSLAGILLLLIPGWRSEKPVSLNEKYHSILANIKLPPGFQIDVWAEVPNARSLALSPSGTIFVGSREKGENGKVYALPDANHDSKPDEVITIASGLTMPNGVALRNGDLYVAEINRVLKFADIEKTMKSKPAFEVVYDKYPKDEHHGWKFIAFGPDGKLYVPVGAPCNICERLDNPVYSTITRLDVDTKQMEIYANGIRNSVGFTWHPQTQEMWFTSNGRDMLGDDIPPDVLCHAPKAGLHFGYPYCHAGEIKDPEFGDKRACSDFAPTAQKLQPHTAALGLRFYSGKMFPQAYQNRIFIAEHGSWNRTVPVGYRITMVTLNGNKPAKYEPFATGWLGDDKKTVNGRPVDLLWLADGSMLISDDHKGLIYRVSYKN
jgi:glucose/arabinose dehydrogenase